MPTQSALRELRPAQGTRRLGRHRRARLRGRRLPRRPADRGGQLALDLLGQSSSLGAPAGRHLPNRQRRPRHPPDAPPSGFPRALAACSIFLIAAAAIALRATNTRGEPAAGPALEAVPATETA